MQNGLQVLSVINQFRNVIAAALDDLGLFGGEAELGEMRRSSQQSRVSPIAHVLVKSMRQCVFSTQNTGLMVVSWFPRTC